MNWYSLTLSLALAGLTACGTKGPGFNPRPSVATAPLFSNVPLTNNLDPALLRPTTDPYRLGPGDVIEIEIVGDAQARAGAIVGPDGKIYYSLLPGLPVWGLTLAQTRELLKSESAKFTRATPEIVLNLRSVASKRVSILGSVPNPGLYPLATPTTLLEAISTAGGIPTAQGSTDDLTDLSKSFILRDGKFLPVNFEQLLKRGDLRQNIYLAPDDFVFIRPANVPSIYVLGAVTLPNVVPFSRTRTVGNTIISSGGLQKYAQGGRVAIVRGGLTQPRIAVVDYNAIVKGEVADVSLEPGDILYVPFSPYRHVAELAESILDQFVRTIAVNEGQALGSDTAQPVSVSSPFGVPR